MIRPGMRWSTKLLTYSNGHAVTLTARADEGEAMTRHTTIGKSCPSSSSSSSSSSSKPKKPKKPKKLPRVLDRYNKPTEDREGFLVDMFSRRPATPHAPDAAP